MIKKFNFSFLVSALTEVYKTGERRSYYKVNQKVIHVHSEPIHFKLSDGAKEEFKIIHNEYEDITKMHAANNFVTGNFN